MRERIMRILFCQVCLLAGPLVVAGTEVQSKDGLLIARDNGTANPDVPTSVSDAAGCGMLITPAPIVIRQDNNGEIAALSNSAAAASRSASAGIANAQISASNRIAEASRQASVSVSLASLSSASIASSASSVLSSMSLRLSSVQSSASSAVAQANSGSESAVKAASILVQAASGSVDAAGTSFLLAAAKVTSNAQASIQQINAAATQLVSQSQAQAKASQALAVSSTNAAIAIVVSIVGSSIITFLAVFFVIRYRKKRRGQLDSKHVDERYPKNDHASGKEFRSSMGSERSYYKDDKAMVLDRGRSRSGSRRSADRDSERGSENRGRSERRRIYQDTYSNRSRSVTSSGRSPTSQYLQESYPVPKFSLAPSIYPKPPQKAKLERLDTTISRAAVVSLAPATSSTENNLRSWLQQQESRSSTSPQLVKPEASQPSNRPEVQNPKIDLASSSKGQIIDSTSTNSRDSMSTFRTSQFLGPFINRDESELAEIKNGNSETKFTNTLSRAGEYMMKSGIGGGLPGNPRSGLIGSGLPSNPRVTVRESTATDASEIFETFEQRIRREAESEGAGAKAEGAYNGKRK